MSELPTSAQMRAIERAAIDTGAVTGLELMERAGRGLIAAAFDEWPALASAPHRAIVLCGPGNNGGDGFVVARLLRQWGWQVEAFLYGDPDRLPPDATTNFQRWAALGTVGRAGDLAQRLRLAGSDAGHPDFSLFIDAGFGVGLSRPLPPEFVDIARALGALEGKGGARARIVSVDVPSGLCADSGRVIGPDPAAVMRGDLTVSFHRLKPGHLLQDGPAICGKSVVASIGLGDGPAAASVVMGNMVHEIGAPSLADIGKAVHGHKYAHGHALILTGGAGRTGAARLAARGALRVGAGMATLGAPGAALQEVALNITALMLRRVEDGAALAEALEDARITALCLGPGLGLERARDLVPVALSPGRVLPVVLDADALTAFADAPEALFAMLHERCVLTPHAGEFARLFPDIAERLAAAPAAGPAFSRVDAARAAAARAGCVVLLKGPDTVIAGPDARCGVHAAHNGRAAPWLATAGSGDVLAGFVTGLMARGLPPMQAAGTAAWLHVEAARAFGPGLIAEDLPEALPAVLRGLAG